MLLKQSYMKVVLKTMPNRSHGCKMPGRVRWSANSVRVGVGMYGSGTRQLNSVAMAL